MVLCSQMVQARRYVFMHLSIMLGCAEQQPGHRANQTEDGWLVSAMQLRIVLCAVILVMICISSDTSKAVVFGRGMRTTQLALTPTGTLSHRIRTPSCMDLFANGGRYKSAGLNSYHKFLMCVNILFRMNQRGSRHQRPLVSPVRYPVLSLVIRPLLCPQPRQCPHLYPQSTPRQCPHLYPQSTPRLQDRRPPRRSPS